MFARTSNTRGGRGQGNQAQRNYDVSDVITVIKKEVDEWRRSRGWPFSVYSPKLPGVIPESYMDEGEFCVDLCCVDGKYLHWLINHLLILVGFSALQ